MDICNVDERKCVSIQALRVSWIMNGLGMIWEENTIRCMLISASAFALGGSMIFDIHVTGTNARI